MTTQRALPSGAPVQRPELATTDGLAVFDPVRFCVMTTVALLCWLFGAPAMVVAMSSLGLWTYARAIRRGLTESRCKLKHPSLILAYLGTAFAGGLMAVVYRLLG